MSLYSSPVLALISAMLVAACASSDPTPAPSSSSSSGSTSSTSSSSSSSGSSGSSGASGTSSAPAPAAPKVDAVGKMMGGLHVMWTNKESSCESIELERKADMPSGESMEKYKVAFTLPGEADNKHDTTATADMKYTYRLRCKKGSTYSEYSNEMSGNPKQ